MTLPTAAPEIRQNIDPETDGFGAVAVKAGEDRWGIMHPLHGGHWGTDAEVAAWTAPSFPAKKSTAK